MGPLIHDLRVAVRILLRNPAVSVISVLTLGLGIGASVAVFSAVDAMLLQPPPFPAPDRLVALFSSKPSAGWTRMTVALPDYEAWRDQSSSFDATAIYTHEAVNLSGAEGPQRMTMIRATSGILRTLGVGAALGRSHGADDDRPGSAPVVTLSDSCWRSRFGARPDVVGTTVTLDGVGTLVLGVLPPEIETALGRFELLAPFTYDPEVFGRGSRNFLALARLRPGADLEATRAELTAVAERQAMDFPRTNRGYGVTITPLDEVLRGRRARPVLFVLSTAVLLVLLIAAVNVANLLIVLARGREREFAVRAALGAETSRIVRQVLTESALLAVCGGVLGLVLAHLGVGLLAAGLDATVGKVGRIAIDGRALAFASGLLGLTTLGFGLPAAVRATRSSFSELIRTGTRSVLGGRGMALRRDALVVVQIAMALALLVSASLMIRSMAALRSVDAGFDTHHLLTLRAALPERTYATDGERASFIESAVGEIRALPGVRSAAATSTIPLIDNNSNSSLAIEDHPISDPADTVFVGAEVVTAGYLETMSIPLVEGRSFTESDRADTPGVIVINRYMAEHFWPGESALGKRVKFGPRESSRPWLEVIGVMGDYRQTSLDSDVRFETLLPQSQVASATTTFVVRTHGAPGALADDVRRAVWRLDPDLALYEVATMDEIVRENSQSQSDVAWLLSAFSLVGMVLAIGGLYGVMSHTVGQQTHEIGLRMAVGADPRGVLLAVIRRSARLIVLGIAMGGLMAWLLGTALRSMLFEVSPGDPVSYVSVATIMVAVGLAAAIIPARRAARINPMAALRCE